MIQTCLTGAISTLLAIFVPSIHGCIADQRRCRFTSNFLNSKFAFATICGHERGSGSSHSDLICGARYSNIRIDIAIMIIIIPGLRHDSRYSLLGRRVKPLPGWIQFTGARCISGLFEFALIPSLCPMASHSFSIQKRQIISVFLRHRPPLWGSVNSSTPSRSPSSVYFRLNRHCSVDNLANPPGVCLRTTYQFQPHIHVCSS
jgi:hypothetical protein